MHTMLGHTKAVWCITGLPRARLLSGSEDRTAKIWDAQNGRCLFTIAGHKD